MEGIVAASVVIGGAVGLIMLEKSFKRWFLR
jgi:hypothetical protein